MFGERFARHVTRQYRRRGLDRTARRMVAFLDMEGLDGVSVLEIGGGVGDIQLELLKRGAERSTNLELSPAYDAAAVQLAREAGLQDRVDRRLADLATDADAAAPADVVVLHRVVCCYPDYERLLAAAATHAERLLVFSHPPANGVARVIVGAQNLVHRLRGSRFRVFTHPPEDMVEVLEAHGMRPVYRHRGLAWRVVGLRAAHPGETARPRAAGPTS
jgi:16S rRNA G966 N2-methylase RsmD